jgi:hypothetical protein
MLFIFPVLFISPLKIYLFSIINYLLQNNYENTTHKLWELGTYYGIIYNKSGYEFVYVVSFNGKVYTDGT